MKLSYAQRKLIERWSLLPDDEREGNVEAHFIAPLFESLGFSGQQVKVEPSIHQSTSKNGLKPDWLIYQDPSEAPVLVVEVKKRDPRLANEPEQSFAATCQQHPLYKDAVGYTSNGIKQYLNKDTVKSGCLAAYGLVISGDFFQLWRRVDGLVLPFTPIQKITTTSLPSLIKQLEHCLHNPHHALVTAVWNQKGGVAKTTNIINIGATLALEGKRVLLIDFDLQGDLTRGVGLSQDHAPDYLRLCVEKLQLDKSNEAKAVLDAAIQVRRFPTSDRRDYALSVLTSKPESIRWFRDHSEFQPVKLFPKLVKTLHSDYDYIFIDVSPAPDTLIQSVLFACDGILIPSDLGSKSLYHAVKLYEHTIPRIREIRGKKEQLRSGPWNLGVVFSNCPNDGAGGVLAKCIEKELQDKNFIGTQCKTRLKTYAQTKVAEFKHAPVVCWQNSPITQLYSQLVNEVFLAHNFSDH